MNKRSFKEILVLVILVLGVLFAVLNCSSPDEPGPAPDPVTVTVTAPAAPEITPTIIEEGVPVGEFTVYISIEAPGPETSIEFTAGGIVTTSQSFFIAPGETIDGVPITVTNTGTVDLDLVISYEQDFTWGSVTVTPDTLGILAPGAGADFQVNVDVDPDVVQNRTVVLSLVFRNV